MVRKKARRERMGEQKRCKEKREDERREMRTKNETGQKKRGGESTK